MLFTALTENVMISLWLSYACSCLLSGSYLLFCQLLVVWHWHQWLKLLLIGKKIVMTLWTCLCGADDSLVPWKSLLFYMLSILPLFGATFFRIERGKKWNYFSSTLLKTISYGRGRTCFSVGPRKRKKWCRGIPVLHKRILHVSLVNKGKEACLHFAFWHEHVHSVSMYHSSFPFRMLLWLKLVCNQLVLKIGLDFGVRWLLILPISLVMY